MNFLRLFPFSKRILKAVDKQVGGQVGRQVGREVCLLFYRTEINNSNYFQVFSQKPKAYLRRETVYQNCYPPLPDVALITFLPRQVVANVPRQVVANVACRRNRLSVYYMPFWWDTLGLFLYFFIVSSTDNSK